jgi:purine-nucleoside phosphorylase
MTDYLHRIDEAVEAIRRRWEATPKAGVILGTGLAGFVDQMEVEQAIWCHELPHFPKASADGHEGRLYCGRLLGVPIVVVSGRCHAYEGYGAMEITTPVRIMSGLGAQLIVLTNASGGMNPSYRSGDVMVIDDHLDFMGRHRSVAADTASLAATAACYCPRLIERALLAAGRGGFVAHRGVYAAVPGPNYETRAEYRFFRSIGADAVGMSTVPEAIVAARLGKRVLGLSAITNMCLPDRLTPARHEDVIAAAQSAEPKMRRIIVEVINCEFGEADATDRRRENKRLLSKNQGTVSSR